MDLHWIIARSKWGSTMFSNGLEMQMKYLHVFGDKGETGALMVATDDNVYGVGHNGYWGLLGHVGGPEISKREFRFRELSGQRVACISVGEKVGAAITANGKIFHWGRSLQEPYEVEEDDFDCAPTAGAHQPAGSDVHHFVAVASGSMFVAGLTIQGQVILWGLIDESASVVYGHVFATDQIMALSCGMYHIAMLSANGDVLTTGFGSDGQLGRKWRSKERYLTPKPVTFKHHCTRVFQVACGFESTLFLMEDGALFAAGLSDVDSGYLGVPFSSSWYHEVFDSPERVVINKRVERIAASNFQPSIYAAETERGIFTWGEDKYPRKLKSETKLISAFYGAAIPPHLGDVLQPRLSRSTQPSENVSGSPSVRYIPPCLISKRDASTRAGQSTPNKPAASTHPRQPAECGANVKNFESQELAAIITDFTELRNEIDGLIKKMVSLQMSSNSKKNKK